MNSISYEFDKMERNLRALELLFNKRTDLERIHKNNYFNKRFSASFGSFSDLKVVSKRLEINIDKVEKLEIIVRHRNHKEDKDIIQLEGQKIRTDISELNAQNQADFKSLYIFAKIFCDDYTQLIKLIFNWRGFGERSITKFYNSLEKYDGKDQVILLFKNKCLDRFRAVNTFITEYRDDHIVHDQNKHKRTTWFVSDMKSGVRFVPGGGGRPSLTPIEAVYVISCFVQSTVDFIKANIDDI